MRSLIDRQAELGREFLLSLALWDELYAQGVITTPDERVRVIRDCIEKARELGLLAPEPEYRKPSCHQEQDRASFIHETEERIEKGER